MTTNAAAIAAGVLRAHRAHRGVAVGPPVTLEAMTADRTRVPYEVLATISTRITNEVPELNGVTVDLTSTPPGTIGWE